MDNNENIETKENMEDGKYSPVNRRRRSLGPFQANLIEPKFQITFISWTVFISFFVITLQYFVENFVSLVFIVLIVDLLLALILSHSIVGPIYKVKKTMRENVEGQKHDKVSLREEDIFKGLQDSVNSYIDFASKSK